MAPPDDHAEELAAAPWSIWRVRMLAALAFTAVALVATARAEKPSTPVDPRPELARQLADEAASIDRALATVTAKVEEVDAARTRRVAAAYRLLRAAPTADATATARRRAAARLLLERDLDERRLLADEVARLAAAAQRTAADAARVPEVPAPPRLVRPVRGTLARSFGTLVHERSKATLARRGLDVEVEARAPVVAAAAGTVRYAGPIRGLDQGVILDHGAYLSVTAKLGDLVVPVGATVAQGDRLGRAARYRVYFELRAKVGAGGRPIDPEPLFEAPSPRPR